MKKIILTGLTCLALAACASTQTAYGPVDGSGIGFRNIQLEPDRFRVSFTARDVDEARDYVLLRAAELTDAEGYSHFKIVDGDTISNGPPASVGTSVGVITGGGFRRRGPIVDLGIGIDDIGRAVEGNKIRETIEVRLLSGAIPNDPDVYHAQSIIKSVQPPVFQ